MERGSSSRIAELEEVLASTRVAILELERRRRASRRAGVILFASVGCLLAWAVHAQTSIRAVAAPEDPVAKLAKRMEAMNAQLQNRIDQLERRVHTLETAPQPPDNDETSSGKKGSTANGGNAGNGNAAGAPNAATPADTSTSTTSQAVFNLIKRVTALENRHVFTAPFLVSDSHGHALLSVADIKTDSVTGAVGKGRGLYVFNDAGQPVVSLTDSGAGGEVRALSPTNDETFAALGFPGYSPQMSLEYNGHTSVSANADRDGDNSVAVMDSSGRTVAELRNVGGKRGQLGLFHEGNNIAALTEGLNGAELELDDMAGTPMVQAGTLSNHTGIVRTGPASRAPGGLMGVPGSFISGKGQ
jgi:hypothetical protein